jgi:hypothetical protein
MHDYFNELFEWDEHGRKRRKRVARDRERISFPMTAMDAAQALGFSSTFSDGSRDFTSPFKPGFRFADIGDAAKIAADEAYDQRRERMANAWRTKGNATHDAAPPRTATLDELRALADAAYQAKCERLQNAWRTSR